MAKFNFRRFKYVALFAGAFLVIAGYLYWLGNLLALWHWTTQNKTLIERVWSALRSPEGVVIWTGLIAVMVLATILVERRLDVAKDLKWKRRKKVLDYKTAKIGQPRKVLTADQKVRLLSLQERGSDISRQCASGAGGMPEAIKKWETEVAEVLRPIGQEQAGVFLHESIVPVQMRGYAPTVMYQAGHIKARMDVLNRIIKEFSS